MSELYPIKFEPILKEKMWGGESLVSKYNKAGSRDKKYGESWELSSVSDSLSIIKNGFLAGNDIQEIIEIYMGDLVGDSVYEKFGIEFPLLIKFIDAKSDLSIQVHPDDELALKRHNAYGKAEMWYILESDHDAIIYTGFNKAVSKDDYLKHVKNNAVPSLLCKEVTSVGEVFFTPPGRIHAICKGNLLVEIQQTSDITYRIWDWGRVDNQGNARELHADLAVDAIDYQSAGSGKSKPEIDINSSINIADCEFFTTNLQWFNKPVGKNYMSLDSFIIYICIEGNFRVCWDGKSEDMTCGDTILIPASLKELVLEPSPEAKLLEVYIKSADNN